jgi:hypothetical protein
LLFCCVMAALVAVIHVFGDVYKGVDAGHKPERAPAKSRTAWLGVTFTASKSYHQSAAPSSD